MNHISSSDGTTIAFDRVGDGPPIVLVDGAIQHRAIDPTTPQVAEFLAPRFTVLHYDRRGRGDSGDTPLYAVEREVEDLGALIGHAGGSAQVFGMSSGAALVLEAAASGLPITRLALYEPPYSVDEDAQQPEGWATELNELIAAGRRGDALMHFMGDMPDEMRAGMQSSPMWPAMESVAHTLAYDVAIMGDGAPPSERIASIAVPTLVIDGGASPAWARNAVQAVVDALPNARRRTLEGQTHEYAADALAPVLAEFFVP